MQGLQQTGDGLQVVETILSDQVFYITTFNSTDGGPPGLRRRNYTPEILSFLELL